MAAGDYPGSTLYPASSRNYSVASRPASNPINKIIVHVTQGSWAGAINWFEDPIAQVSAHYTVRSSDGAVGQSVREKDIAWHAGNWSYNQTSTASNTKASSAIQAGLPKQCIAPRPNSRPTCATSTASRETGAT